MSKQSPDRTIPSRITINVILQVSKPRIDPSTQQTYYTASLDVFASQEGREIFEYFHILSIPDRPSKEFTEMRRYLNQSLMADLTEFVGKLERDGRLAEEGGIT